MDEIKKFLQNRKENINKMAQDSKLKKQGLEFLCDTSKYNYSYNFDWLSRPIIQYPQDMIAFQEIVWNVKPDLIIEMGIAHGGSLIYSASLLAMIDLCENGKTSVTPEETNPRSVIGVDIDIRSHNLNELKLHPLFPRINLIEGSSIDIDIIEKVKKIAKDYKNILVCLDSNHTHDHVYKELEAYAPLVSKGSYCIVFDTVIDELSDELNSDRSWSHGNSPKSAVKEYLAHIESKNTFGNDGTLLNLSCDYGVQDKLLISVAPEGYLKRI